MTLSSLATPTRLALAWTLLILGLCTLPSAIASKAGGFGIDKLAHAVAFAGFGWLWLRAGWRLGTALVLGAAFGVFIEVWQEVLPIGRRADGWDIAADLVGLALGVGAWMALRRRRASDAGPTAGVSR